MKKLFALISGVSIAALIGFSNVTLADEEEAAEEANKVAVEGDETNKKPMARGKSGKDPDDGDEAQGLNSTGNEVALEVLGIKALDDGDEGGDDIEKGSGDPLKGLLGGKGVPCKPCDFPGGTVSTGEDDGDEAGKEKVLPDEAADKAREATSKEKKKGKKDKKKDKKK